jgi:predicted nucleic acid-binding protein
MSVLVDTSVWSLALRRARPMVSPHVARLADLVRSGEVVLIGPIRQEILSGIRNRAHFVRMRDHLASFPDLPLRTDDFVRAAEHANTCRAGGVQGSSTDFVITAVSERYDLEILTTDRDFERFARVLPIRLVR